MRSSIFIATLISSLAICGPAIAQEVGQESQASHRPILGITADVGVPSGVALSLDAHAVHNFFDFGFGPTFNVILPGIRTNLRLDPLATIRFPVGLIFDLQGGWEPEGAILVRSHSLPHVGYEYVNLYAGLRLGYAHHFHWLLEAGPTYLDVQSDHLSNVVADPNSISLGNLHASGWVIPTFITGPQFAF